jgi:hypothetical protein
MALEQVAFGQPLPFVRIGAPFDLRYPTAMRSNYRRWLPLVLMLLIMASIEALAWQFHRSMPGSTERRADGYVPCGNIGVGEYPCRVKVGR